MSKYEEILQKFEEIGFKILEQYTLDSSDIIMERELDGNTHRLIIEDHRWERAERDFDPTRDVGDWLIFSGFTDDERDYFGHYVTTQCPLTLCEVHLVEELIHVLEEKLRTDLDTAGV